MLALSHGAVDEYQIEYCICKHFLNFREMIQSIMLGSTVVMFIHGPLSSSFSFSPNDTLPCPRIVVYVHAYAYMHIRSGVSLFPPPIPLF